MLSDKWPEVIFVIWLNIVTICFMGLVFLQECI